MTKILNKVIEYILAAMMILMVFGCVWQIFTRFILRNPSDWTEEFVRYILIWLTMIGVPYAYGQDKHISIGFVTSTFTPKGLAMDKMFREILLMIISILLVVGGIMVTMNATGQVSAALQIPMPVYYSGVPVCGVLMLIYGIPKLIDDYHELSSFKKEGK